MRQSQVRRLSSRAVRLWACLCPLFDARRRRLGVDCWRDALRPDAFRVAAGRQAGQKRRNLHAAAPEDFFALPRKNTGATF